MLWLRNLIATISLFQQSPASTVGEPRPAQNVPALASVVAEDTASARELLSICVLYGLGDEASDDCGSQPNNLSSARDLLEASLFLSLYEISGLEDLLRCPGPLTVLLPTNKAVIALGEDRLTALLDPSNRAELVQLLLYHTIPTSTLQNGRLPTLADEASIVYHEGTESFDTVAGTGGSSTCNGQLVLLQRVLDTSTNTGKTMAIVPVAQRSHVVFADQPSTSPNLAPSIEPSSVLSELPSSAPSAWQRTVEIEPFSIAYSSENSTRPSDAEVAELNGAVEAYYTDLFKSLFEASELIVFESLRFEFDFAQFGDSSLPGYNIYVQYRSAIFEFSKKQGGQGRVPPSEDLFEEMKNGITVDFLLDVVRTRLDTAFADVIMGRMLLVPQTEKLDSRFFIAYNSENATKPDEETFQQLARVNQAYFNDYFLSVFEGDGSTDFVGVVLELESTGHGTETDFPVDGFNILLRYSNAVFFFGAKSRIPSDMELFDFLKEGITFDYLIEVRNLFFGTAFGDSIEALLDLDV
jgi:hypothetical protein